MSFPRFSSHRLLPFGGALLAGLLGGCATPTPPPAAPAPESASAPVSNDYRLVMGEIALSRGAMRTATEQYLYAAAELPVAGVARRALLIAILAGDIGAARAAADRWEKLAPRDLEAAQYQAVLHARSGDTDAAYGYLLRLAEGDTPAIVGANLQMITTLLAGERNIWRAADLMARLAATRPERPEGWHGAALLALEADRPARAAEFSARALQLQPANADALFLHARAVLATQPGAAPESALEPLQKFRAADDPGLRYRYAGVLVLAGEAARALAVYREILASNPEQHDARMAVALLALDAGRLHEAEAALHALLERHVRVQDALFYLGALAEERGEPDTAADWYARVTPDPVDPWRWLQAQAALGRLLIRHEGPDMALDFFNDLRAQWPAHAYDITLTEATVFMNTGNPRLALAVIDNVGGAFVGERRELDWRAGLAAAEAGLDARAEKEFRSLLLRDPGNPALQNQLGALLIEQERLAEAAALLDSALAAAPANPAVLASAGWLRHRQNDPRAARSLLEESWRRQPLPVTGLRLLAVLRALNDAPAAAALRRELDARFPDLPETGETE